MYKIDDFNKSDLLFLLVKRNYVPYIIDNNLVIYNNAEIIFSKDKDCLGINDLIDILDIQFCDSKYVYYLVDIAFDNSSKDKKKSLRL